jgi:acetate kinase
VTRVLVVNAGSSSLKLGVVEPEGGVSDHRHLEEWDGETEAITELVERARPDAVGHRVVHGGPGMTGPAVIDETVLDAIRAATELAPLHQPRALAGIDAAASAGPGLPAVACFDTAFHRTMPAAASTYAVPRSWRERFGVRRYGFHGLSHAHVTRRAAQIVGGEVTELRTVSCHLGSGASVCAVDRGRSVATSMGMTPLEGLVMGTRAGSVDPGMLLWLLRTGRLSPAELEDGLEHHSGLRGLAGTTDLGELLGSHSDAARLAVEVYVHRLTAEVAAMASATGGLDVLAFTGGVGENAPAVRCRAAERLGFLGVALDQGRNDRTTGDSDVSAPEAKVRTVVVESREDLEIAREVRALLDNAVAE